MSEEKIRINGGKTLSGQVGIDGSKNSALVCIAASCLTTEEIILKNIPDISDVDIMIEILRLCGKQIERNGDTVAIRGAINKTGIPQELASKIRASYYCLGVFLALEGRAEIPLPGGDRIGDRPIDIHLDCLSDIGVQTHVSKGTIFARLEPAIHEDIVFLRYPSVGATSNLIIVASKIGRKTVIKNAAKEPEVVDLAHLLNKMGVKISGAGSDTINIVGCEKMSGGFCHEIIPDRIETGVILTSIAAAGGSGTIKNCIPEHNIALISTLKKSGAKISINRDNSLYIEGNAPYKPLNVTALPYPGIPTDLQPLICAFSLKCRGESVITDQVFPERFAYISELNKMGARIIHFGNTIRITGTDEIYGKYVEGTDIRSVTALICAGLIAENETLITGLYHLKRGYGNLCGKLNMLGADIKIY